MTDSGTGAHIFDDSPMSAASPSGTWTGPSRAPSSGSATSGDFFGPDSSLGTVFGPVLDRNRTASASIVGPKWDPLHFKIVYKYSGDSLNSDLT